MRVEFASSGRERDYAGSKRLSDLKTVTLRSSKTPAKRGKKKILFGRVIASRKGSPARKRNPMERRR